MVSKDVCLGVDVIFLRYHSDERDDLATLCIEEGRSSSTKYGVVGVAWINNQ